MGKAKVVRKHAVTGPLSGRGWGASDGEASSPWLLLGGAALSMAGAFMALRPALRAAVQASVRRAMTRLMHDSYGENLWEFVSASRRPGLQTIVETSLRAYQGTPLYRPLGSPRPWPNMSGLAFRFAQVARRPTAHDVPVDLAVTLGPRAERPLRVEIPILVSGMAYGLALSARAKLALARGATLAGTASNTGEGPILPLERQLARRLIVQFGRANWGKSRAWLRQADMIEIQVGQGAAGGAGGTVIAARTSPELRALLGARAGVDAITYSHHPEWPEGAPLRELVDRLREWGEGVPVGVKLAASGDLEDDLAACLEAGVDVIALDGGQAATRGSPATLQDDFGLPTVHAVVRAERFLREAGRRGEVSLIVSGGLYTPGDYLKAIALGADAVYVGTMALFALSHTQVFKSMPWEPPTQLVFFGGQQAGELNYEEAAAHLANYLRSCAQEMALAIRSMGKSSLRDVNRDDLMALDPETAETTGVVPSWVAPEQS